MPESGDSVSRGLELFAERVARLPEALAEASAEPLIHLGEHFEGGPFAITGAGGSEGPARVFGDQLARAGLAARFIPLSSFAHPHPPLRAADRLVVFSQGLSPNARLALAHGQRVAARILVTATTPDATAPPGSSPHALARAVERGWHILAHGPPSEGELLVRVIGPALATLVGLRLAAQLTQQPLDTAPVAEAVRRALDRVPETVLSEGPGHVHALVIAGDGGPRVHGLRWKLLEALPHGDPPVWDVLQFAHGPFQQYYERPATLITLEHGDPVEADLFERFVQLVEPRGHRVIRLVAKLASPLSWFEHDAMLDALALHDLRRAPRDLIEWPGKGCDQPLYAIDRPRD
jgi:creatinine amidohydrolase